MAARQTRRGYSKRAIGSPSHMGPRKGKTESNFMTQMESVRHSGPVASIGAITLGSIGVAAATAIGVGEVLVGAVMAYVTYRVIRYGIGPQEGITGFVKLEHGGGQAT